MSDDPPGAVVAGLHGIVQRRSIWLKVRALVQTTSLEFRRNFGTFQHQAQCEPVEITHYGQRALVLMSAEHYEWLTAAAKRRHRTVNAPQVVLDAVERAEMDPHQAALDELLG
ncbi:MAG TPA: type II toxin-antitoxin system prevent-host-death family antitoxin [Rhizobium sp.]